MKKLLFVFFVLFFASCQDEPHTTDERGMPLHAEFKKPDHVQGEVDTIPDRILTRKDYTERSGSAGVFKVDKMLALSVRDSSDEANLPKKYAAAFTKLEMELRQLKIKPFGAPGVITYNDDPANTVFECIYPLDSIPKRRPLYCHIAIIRAENMLIYNHYGSYGELPNSYQKIVKLMLKNGLLKSGPLREFYVTDPSKEKDQSKWLTRVMIPVIKKATLDSLNEAAASRQKIAGGKESK